MFCTNTDIVYFIIFISLEIPVLLQPAIVNVGKFVSRDNKHDWVSGPIGWPLRFYVRWACVNTDPLFGERNNTEEYQTGVSILSFLLSLKKVLDIPSKINSVKSPSLICIEYYEDMFIIPTAQHRSLESNYKL